MELLHVHVVGTLEDAEVTHNKSSRNPSGGNTCVCRTHAARWQVPAHAACTYSYLELQHPLPAGSQ